MMATKKLTRKQIENRVRKLIPPYRADIESINPRPKDHPYDLGWSLAFNVDSRGVEIVAWSVTPGMLLPFEECMGKSQTVLEPWTECGKKFFAALKDLIEEETGVACRITHVLGIWEWTFGK